MWAHWQLYWPLQTENVYIMKEVLLGSAFLEYLTSTPTILPWPLSNSLSFGGWYILGFELKALQMVSHLPSFLWLISQYNPTMPSDSPTTFGIHSSFNIYHIIWSLHICPDDLLMRIWIDPKEQLFLTHHISSNRIWQMGNAQQILNAGINE
jgi:hypothetical protein